VLSIQLLGVFNLICFYREHRRVDTTDLFCNLLIECMVMYLSHFRYLLDELDPMKNRLPQKAHVVMITSLRVR
jgi:hypothetical protein